MVEESSARGGHVKIKINLLPVSNEQKLLLERASSTHSLVNMTRQMVKVEPSDNHERGEGDAPEQGFRSSDGQ